MSVDEIIKDVEDNLVLSEGEGGWVEMGGKGSGHWRHKGRKGKRGGSAPSKGGMSLKSLIAQKVGANLQKYITNGHRQGLVEAFDKELPLALEAAGIDEKDIQEIVVHGSFLSSKKDPGDLDIICKVKEETRQAESIWDEITDDFLGTLDIESWSQYNHKAPIAFITGWGAFDRTMEEYNFSRPSGYDKPISVYP